MQTQIVRSPRGQARRYVDVNTLQVPDLWHVAMALQDLADEKPVEDKFHRSIEASTYATWSEMVLDTWHLAHDLLHNIQNAAKPVEDR